jgi:hypothetical protein
MVFGNAVNFIIHLLTNIPEQFDLTKLIQVTFILFGVNIVIRLIAIFLFEPFNLFIERYQRKLRPTVTETSEEESVLVSTNSDENQSTINEDSPTQPQEAQQIDPTEIN